MQRAHAVVGHYVTAFLLAELQHDREVAAALAPDRQDLPEVGYRARGY